MAQLSELGRLAEGGRPLQRQARITTLFMRTWLAPVLFSIHQDPANEVTEMHPIHADYKQAPDLWLRITVISRRMRFAKLLSRLAGVSLEEAWKAFPVLSGPDGPWGVPHAAMPGS